MIDLNEYKPADSHEIGTATETVRGVKPNNDMDTIVDPDTNHRPDSFAEYDD